MARKSKEENTLPIPDSGTPPIFVSREEACRHLGGICIKTLENQFLKTNRLRVTKFGRRSVIRFADLQRLAREAGR